VRSPFPIFVFLDRIRSLYNVGAFFRTCDATGVEKIYLSGYSPVPPRKEISKTALGAEHSVPHEYVRDAVATLRTLQEQGIQIVAVETGEQAIDYATFQPRFPICVVFGNEVTGVDPDILALADARIALPMHGIKESLNVVVCGGIVLYDLLRKASDSSSVS